MKIIVSGLFIALFLWVAPSTAFVMDLNTIPAYIRVGFESEWIKNNGQNLSEWKQIPVAEKRSLRIPNLDLPQVPKRRFLSVKRVKAETFTFLFYFNIDSKILKSPAPLGFYFPRIGDNWEIFLNGSSLKKVITVDSNGGTLKANHHRYLLLPVSRDIFQETSNCLAIKIIGDPTDKRTGLGFSKNNCVGTLSDLQIKFGGEINLIFIFLYGLIGFYHIFLNLRRQKEKQHLYFGLFSIFLSIYLACNAPYFQDIITNPTLLDDTELFFMCLLLPFFGLMLDSLFLKKIHISTKIYVYGSLLFIPPMVLMPPRFANDIVTVWEIVMIFPMFHLVFKVFILFLNRILTLYSYQQKKTIGKILFTVTFNSAIGNFFAGTVALFIAATIEISDDLFWKTGIRTINVGFLFFIFGNLLALSNRFYKTHDQLENIRKHLKEEISVRTFQLIKSNAELHSANIEVKRLNQSLEERIADKTKALQIANVELVENQVALMQAKDEAESANEMKSNFLASMSHELRTPLHVILGVSSVLSGKSAVQNEPDLKSQIDLIKKSGIRLLSLVNNILDIHRLEKGIEACKPSLFKLSDLIDEINLVSKNLILEKSIAFWVSLDPSLNELELQTDRVKLAQILNNLITNAIKFTPEGRIDVIISEKKESLIFKIMDTGIGIPTEKLSAMFKPFTQLDMGLARKYKGTGLGLAITKSYVELLGGQIWVESQFNEGTTFSFSILKNVEINHIITVSQDPGTESNYKKTSILVCDDDQFNLEYAQLIMKDRFNYELVYSGQDAEKKANEKKFDVIFLDIEMPGFDGYQTLNLIRHTVLNAGTPIVAVTAHNSDSEKAKLIEKGFDAYLIKPFSEVEFLKRVKKILTPLRVQP